MTGAALPRRKYTIDEMWTVCAQLAADIDCDQGARIIAGYQDQADPRQMHFAFVLEQVCLWLEVTKAIEPDFRSLVSRHYRAQKLNEVRA